VAVLAAVGIAVLGSALAPRPATGKVMVAKRAPASWLGKLPNDSAAYFGARIDGLARVITLLPGPWGGDQLRRELAEVLGAPIGDAAALSAMLADRLGVDPARAMSASAMTVDEPAARKAMERMLAAARSKGPKKPGYLLDALRRVGKPALMHARVVVPLAPGADLDRLVEGLSALTRGELAPCKVAPDCTKKDTAKLRAAGILAIARVERGAIAFSQDGSDAIIDVVLDAFGSAEAGAIVARLAAVARMTSDGRGGPDPALGSCASLPEGAAWSMCVDPRRLAELGAVQGWSLTFSAVAAVSPEYLPDILEAGFKEADSNIAIARASGHVVTDFGAALRADGDAIVVSLRWTTTDLGRAAIAAVVGAGLGTRDDGELVSKLLVPLRARLPRPTSPLFADASIARDAVAMGGGPAFGLVLAHAWPEMLATPGGDEWLEPLRKPLGGRPPSPPWKWRIDGSDFVGDAKLPRR